MWFSGHGGHGSMVGLDILEVFFKLNDSMILWFSESIVSVQMRWEMLQAVSEQLCCVFAAKCSFLGYFCWEVPAASALFQEEKGQKWEREIAEAVGSSQLRAVPCGSPCTYPLCLHTGATHPLPFVSPQC